VSGLVGVWPTLPPGVYARRPGVRLPFPLDAPRCRVFMRARHGLWQGVRALGLQPGDEVLVPAYHHGSEVEALRLAGLVCRFYDGDDELALSEPELESLAGARTRALYLIHYLGFPQDASRWRRWCDEHGLFLLEDAAQSWLASVGGEPVGSAGDLAIFCLYKTFGVPDGGAVLARVEIPPPSGRRLGAAALARRHAWWLLGRAGRLARRGREPGAYDPGLDFALGTPTSPPALATMPLVRRLAREDVAAVRRAHYRRLLADLGEAVPAPFARLPEGASPFALPIRTQDKPRLLARLRSAGVDALDFWSVPHPDLRAEAHPQAAARRGSTVCLPVHQELRPADLDRIAEAAA